MIFPLTGASQNKYSKKGGSLTSYPLTEKIMLHSKSNIRAGE